jgi:NADH-quinone oxidoreductase subunit A
MSDYFTGYLTVGILLLVGVLLLSGAYAANRLLAPRNVRGAGAPATYECGIDIDLTGGFGAAMQYYVYAFIYVVFAVESVFLYPWATVFADPGFGGRALAEMGIFIGLLVLALLYAWRKRVLAWV